MGLSLALRIGGAFLLLPLAALANAETLRITSNPAGATVEIDGVAVGATPYEQSMPGGYFHRTRTSLGSRLEHPMVLRVSLAGYATKELQLTEGPMNGLTDFHGRRLREILGKRRKRC